VVEDNEDTREPLKALLQSCGAEVHTAGSAPEALESLRHAKPDLLLCDIGLPGQDGFALLHRIRAMKAEEGGHVPAIALTAFAQSQDREQSLAAGFQAHLPKPVDQSVLIRTIEVVLRTVAASSEAAGRQAVRSRRFRIAVVDDAKDLADIFAMLLQEMGHEVHVFYSGPQILRHIGGLQPNIIFSDISMREMNGYELAKHVREIPEIRDDIVLVAMTGFGAAELADHASEVGFDHFMVKPVTRATMEDFFARMLPGTRRNPT
jgi:CheY-like chemotaxis protein